MLDLESSPSTGFPSSVSLLPALQSSPPGTNHLFEMGIEGLLFFQEFCKSWNPLQIVRVLTATKEQ